MMTKNKNKKLYPHDDIYSEMDQVERKIEDILTSVLANTPTDEEILSAQIRIKNQLVHSINKKSMDQKKFVAQVCPEEGSATQSHNVQNSQPNNNIFMNFLQNKPLVIFSTLTLITIITLSGVGIYYLNSGNNNRYSSTEVSKNGQKNGDIVTLAKERFRQLYGIEYDDYVKIASNVSAPSNTAENFRDIIAPTGRPGSRQIMAKQSAGVQSILDNVDVTRNKGALYTYTVDLHKADYTKYMDVYIPIDTPYVALQDFMRYPEAKYEYYVSLYSTGALVQRDQDVLYAYISYVSNQGDDYNVKTLEYKNGKFALEGNYIHPKTFYEGQNISYIQFTPDYILLQKLESKNENVKDLGVKEIDGVKYRVIEETINVLGPVYTPPVPSEMLNGEEPVGYQTESEMIIKKTYYVNPDTTQIVKVDFSEGEDLLFSIKYETNKIVENSDIQNKYNDVRNVINKLGKEIKTFDFGAVYDVSSYPKLADFVKKYPTLNFDTDRKERLNFYDNDSEVGRLYNEYFRLYFSQDFDPASQNSYGQYEEGLLAYFSSMKVSIEYYKSGAQRSNIVCTGKKSAINIKNTGTFETEVCKYSYDNVMTIQPEKKEGSTNLLPPHYEQIIYKLSQKIGSYSSYDIYISVNSPEDHSFDFVLISESAAKQYDEEISQITTMETVSYGGQIDQSKVDTFIATPVDFVKKENYSVYDNTFKSPYYSKEETCITPLKNAQNNPRLLDYLYMQHKYVLDCLALVGDGYILSYYAYEPSMYEMPAISETEAQNSDNRVTQIGQSSFDVYIFKKNDFTSSILEFYITYLNNQFGQFEEKEYKKFLPVYKGVDGYIVVIIRSMFWSSSEVDTDFEEKRNRLLDNIRILNEQEKKLFFDKLHGVEKDK